MPLSYFKLNGLKTVLKARRTNVRSEGNPQTKRRTFVRSEGRIRALRPPTRARRPPFIALRRPAARVVMMPRPLIYLRRAYCNEGTRAI